LGCTGQAKPSAETVSDQILGRQRRVSVEIAWQMKKHNEARAIRRGAAQSLITVDLE
jgi:hypothetical protein